MTKTTRRKLTAHEQGCAKRINKLWMEKRRAEKITQPVAADALKMTPSGFNQYINGKIPLNTDATYQFAQYFGVKPRDIDPHWLGGEEKPEGVQDVDEIYNAVSRITTKEQDLAAVQAIAGRVSPKDAIRLARFFLDRAEAGL